MSTYYEVTHFQRIKCVGKRILTRKSYKGYKTLRFVIRFLISTSRSKNIKISVQKLYITVFTLIIQFPFIYFIATGNNFIRHIPQRKTYYSFGELCLFVNYIKKFFIMVKINLLRRFVESPVRRVHTIIIKKLCFRIDSFRSWFVTTSIKISTLSIVFYLNKKTNT